jgi:hypothetical protein
MDRLGRNFAHALADFGGLGYSLYNLRSRVLLMIQMVDGYASYGIEQDSDGSGSWTSSSTCTLDILSTATSSQKIFFSVTLMATALRY